MLCCMASYPSDWDSRREQVYRRDNYECQNCGREGGTNTSISLHAHHVVPKSQGGSHDKSNLISVCEDCHHAIHGDKEAPKGNNTGNVQKSGIDDVRDLQQFIESLHKLTQETNALITIFADPDESEPDRTVIDRDWKETVREKKQKLIKLKYQANNINISPSRLRSGLDTSSSTSEISDGLNEISRSTVQVIGSLIQSHSVIEEYIDCLSEKQCSNCGDIQNHSADFCTSCGDSLQQVWNCSDCDSEIEDLDIDYCPSCGGEYAGMSESKMDEKRELLESLRNLSSQNTERYNQYDSKVGELMG